MSLSVAGVWAVGVWDQTVWADGVWREGAYSPAVEEAETAGGRKRKSGRRYPRWVQIDGKRYRVSSPEEERRLLAAMLDRAREAANAGPPGAQQKALKRVVKLSRRIEKVGESEALWMQRLREMDEELISILEA